MDEILWRNVLLSRMEPRDAIILVVMTILLFAFLLWLLPANDGTKIGIGVGGCIGVIGIACGPLGLFIGIALGGTLGGFIGSGIQGRNDKHHQEMRETQQQMLNQQRELHEQRMLTEQQKSKESGIFASIKRFVGIE